MPKLAETHLLGKVDVSTVRTVNNFNVDAHSRHHWHVGGDDHEGVLIGEVPDAVVVSETLL